MAKKKTATKSNGTNGSFSTALANVLTSAQALRVAITALGLPGLTNEERLHSLGRLREGEPEAPAESGPRARPRGHFRRELAARWSSSQPGSQQRARCAS